VVRRVGLKLAGKPILLAARMSFMFRTELATILSEFKPMARMHGRLLDVTTRGLTMTRVVGSGNALRLSQFTLVFEWDALKRAICYSVKLKIERPGRLKRQANNKQIYSKYRPPAPKIERSIIYCTVNFHKSLSTNDLARPGFRKSLTVSHLGKSCTIPSP
jgi:hypothetical protein